MILSGIRNYMQGHGQASLADIAVHFDSEPDAVRGMLDIWMRKGKIHRRSATDSCGSSCSQCDTAVTEIYVWVSNILPVERLLPAGCNNKD
ncbi:MAG: FeoC-like transcriptional regulator [Arenicellales bacterium]